MQHQSFLDLPNTPYLSSSSSSSSGNNGINGGHSSEWQRETSPSSNSSMEQSTSGTPPAPSAPSSAALVTGIPLPRSDAAKADEATASIPVVPAGKRIMGVSCVACKTRKVKCDRRAKLERKRQTHGLDYPEDGIQCTHCSNHGFKCQVAKTMARPRQGARLRQLQAAQAQTDEYTPGESGSTDAAITCSGTSCAPSDASFPSQGSSSKPSRPTHLTAVQSRSQPNYHDFAASQRQEDAQPMRNGYDTPTDSGITHPWARNSASSSAQSAALTDLLRPPLPSTSDSDSTFINQTGLYTSMALLSPSECGLLGVQGLDRHLLEACLKAYFVWNCPTAPRTRGSDFTLRYRSYLDRCAGFENPVPPASEYLILALSAVGAGMLEEGDAPLVGIDKFELQDRLMSRFLSKLHAQKFNTLEDDECVDILEACAATSFKEAEDGENDTSDNFSSRTLSEEVLMRLALKIRLNHHPKLEPRAPEDGPRWRTGRGARLLDDAEVLRRKRIFLFIYYNDGFRSMGTRKPPMLPNDCHDLLPKQDAQNPLGNFRLFPRWDPGFMPDGPLSVEQGTDDELESLFERLLILHIGKLSISVRKWGPTFVSVRSQGLGIPARSAAKAVDEWTMWRRQTPAEIVFRLRLPVDWIRGKVARPTGYELFKLFAALFWELLYHAQILSAAAAVDDFGLTQDADECGKPARRTEEDSMDIPALTTRIRRLAYESLAQTAFTCKAAGALGILRSNPVVCRNVPAAFVMWACQHAATADREDWEPDVGTVLQQAEDIVDGISTVDSASGTPGMCAALRESIWALRQSPGGEKAPVSWTTSATPSSVASIATDPTDALRDVLLATSEEAEQTRSQSQSYAGPSSHQSALATTQICESDTSDQPSTAPFTTGFFETMFPASASASTAPGNGTAHAHDTLGLFNELSARGSLSAKADNSQAMNPSTLIDGALDSGSGSVDDASLEGFMAGPMYQSFLQSLQQASQPGGGQGDQ